MAVKEKMTVEFSTSNDAFVEGRELSVADALRAIVNDVELGYRKGTVFDYNGNHVGSWSLTLPND